MLKSKLLLISFFLSISGYVQAQDISGDFQKKCIQEQLQEHKDIKKKSLTEEDFKPYCSCLAEYISKNASSKQVNELVMNPKSKPEWLKSIEQGAMKSCLATDSKMST
ncbi:hypothetical protein G6728_06875 [Polynucleobacter paneuropaeus]|nr:hypothetical protein G6728_06875 [Polynucleobacter paneuropaeus]